MIEEVKNMNESPTTIWKWKYVVRDNKLYKTEDKEEILDGELYGMFGNTPTTPPDITMTVFKKRIDDTWDEELKMVVNFDYYYYSVIKNYILGVGDFYDWWNEEAFINMNRYDKLKNILNS